MLLIVGQGNQTIVHFNEKPTKLTNHLIIEQQRGS